MQAIELIVDVAGGLWPMGKSRIPRCRGRRASQGGRGAKTRQSSVSAVDNDIPLWMAFSIPKLTETLNRDAWGFEPRTLFSSSDRYL
jgi:hypothetical protein